jgi:hypothetical protein
MPKINLEITPRQEAFINASATEVLFGGAAGGGKSYAQVIDAMLYALKYAGSRQLILRKTLVELEMSILNPMRELFPQDLCKENISSHTFKWKNGSIIYCGYLDKETDVYRYQGAEFDVVRFDELTHFDEFVYTYLLSRVRGTKPFPRCIKSSTNPTGKGRVWVKERFVDIGEANSVHEVITGYRADGSPIISRRIFLPSFVDDNTFLMASDPDYKARLELLPESEKKGLLFGEWDYFLGQYFEEFSRPLHVCEPFEIPKEWRRYRTLDYGLDMLACLWVAVDSTRNVYVYKEIHESNLPISTAAAKINDFTLEDEDIYLTLAPPDLWGRSQESGKSRADLFYEAGLSLTKSRNDREAGWLAIKELLKQDANGDARLHIFSNCTNLIKNLPALMRDEKKPSDAALEPHEITHACDALRYFSIYWFSNAHEKAADRIVYPKSIMEDYKRANAEQRLYIERKMGGKPKW